MIKAVDTGLSLITNMAFCTILQKAVIMVELIINSMAEKKSI